MRDAVLPVRGFSTNAYIITGQTLMLVDVGVPRVMKLIEKAIAAAPGLSLDAVRAVTATHWHVDHVGGLSEVFKKTRADLYVSERIAYHLEMGKRIIYPAFGRFINMLRNRADVKVTLPRPRDLRQIDLVGLPLQRGNRVKWKVTGYFKDGDALPGHPEWTVIETPGHTPDSVCFWHERSGTLLCGDTILGGRLGAAPNRFIWDDALYAASLEKLRKLKVRRLLPGHGCVVEGRDVLASL